MKKCRICGQEKPINEFYKHPNCVDGYNTKCKVCVHVYETTMRGKKEINKKKSSKFFRWDPKNMTI